ncbi:fatty acid desaturase CarF family protein [Sphingomonas qilianensis]
MLLSRLAVGAFVAAMIGILALAVRDVGLWTVPALLVGWFLADAASGLTHMIMDYRPCPSGRGLAQIYFYEGSRESADYVQLRDAAMARIGPLDRLTYDFKNHHPRPDALGRRSVWRQIGSTVIVGTLPVSLLLLALWAVVDLPSAVMAGGFSFLLGSAFAQYFHGTLHRDDNPRIVHVMRACRLLMTPAAHEKHHATLKQDFATNCGWSNPVINPLFRAAHRAGYLRDEGLEPHH